MRQSAIGEKILVRSGKHEFDRYIHKVFLIKSCCELFFIKHNSRFVLVWHYRVHKFLVFFITTYFEFTLKDRGKNVYK